MTAATPPQVAPGWLRPAYARAPGVLLTLILAWAAFGLRTIDGVDALSPLILAMLLGVAVRNLMGVPAAAVAGVVFSQKQLIRAAIVLLGLQITASKIGAIGLSGLGVAAVALAATFAFTLAFGRVLKVDRPLSVLIAGGVSVCGASAIAAFNAAAKAEDEDVAYAVAAITAFGTVAMFAFPLAPAFLDLSARAYGVWTGAALHEIAQVAGAGFQLGPEAGEAAMVAKLSRVALLAPLVIAFAWFMRRGGGDAARPSPPWFLFGFVAAAALASLVALPPPVIEASAQAAAFMMTMALAAMGLEVDAGRLRRKGWRPLVLAGTASILIAAVSLVLVKAWAI